MAGNAAVNADQLAEQFERHRPFLHAIAYRTLGSHQDADDAVQEAWLRLARTGAHDVHDLRAWLATVTGRICLDALRRRQVRNEQPLELVLDPPPEPAGAARTEPEREALLAEAVGTALYVVMGALTPAERVCFVLHDVFELPFATIAAALGRSTAAVKMLASRARARIRLVPPEDAADSAAREVIDAFFAAADRGDVAGLLAVLAPDVELRTEGADRTFAVRGAGRVAAGATLGARRPIDVVRPLVFAGRPAVLFTEDERPVRIMAFTVSGGLITQLRILSDPGRLAAALPEWIARREGTADADG